MNLQEKKVKQNRISQLFRLSFFFLLRGSFSLTKIIKTLGFRKHYDNKLKLFHFDSFHFFQNS